MEATNIEIAIRDEIEEPDLNKNVSSPFKKC